MSEVGAGPSGTSDSRSEALDEGVRGILFAHGEMAQGLVDAVQRIAGPPEHTLVPLSNEDRTPDDLLAQLEGLAGNRPVIVFTDLLSGSCATAARMTSRNHPDRAVICGVNLPMLLDFVFHRELPLEDLVERLVQKGREGIRALPPPI